MDDSQTTCLKSLAVVLFYDRPVLSCTFHACLWMALESDSSPPHRTNMHYNPYSPPPPLPFPPMQRHARRQASTGATSHVLPPPLTPCSTHAPLRAGMTLLWAPQSTEKRPPHARSASQSLPMRSLCLGAPRAWRRA
jgi:hypothetical protein